MTAVKISDSARLIGMIRLGSGTYIAQGTVLRSEADSIRIGNQSWVLENAVMIGTSEHPLIVGGKTVFGHKCIAIGCQIGNLCEIGNGTIFLPGSVIGDECIFGEGTLIPAGMVIPERSVVVGRPGRVIRRLNEADRAMIRRMRGGDVSLDEYSETVIHHETGGAGAVGKLYDHAGKSPQIAESVRIYDSAEITGDVVIGEGSIIGAGVRIIGDSHGPVRIGRNVQILENTVLHLLPDNELVIEDDVTIGPGCIIHGTTIGQGTVIESGAILCDYSSLGANSLVRSGSLVKQRSSFPEHVILEGFPAKVTGTNDGLDQRPDWGFR